MLHPENKSPFSLGASQQARDTFMMDSFEIEKLENYLDAKEIAHKDNSSPDTIVHDINETKKSDFYLPLKAPGHNKNSDIKLQQDSFSLLSKLGSSRTDKPGGNNQAQLEGRMQMADSVLEKQLNEAVMFEKDGEMNDDTALIAELERVLKGYEGQGDFKEGDIQYIAIEDHTGGPSDHKKIEKEMESKNGNKKPQTKKLKKQKTNPKEPQSEQENMKKTQEINKKTNACELF